MKTTGSSPAPPSPRPELPEQLRSEQEDEKRRQLIGAVGFFKPPEATPTQFFNLVRELCIVDCCSVDVSIEKAKVEFPKLSLTQRSIYESEQLAQLPIPVPAHLAYRAQLMEREGLLTLGRASLGGKGRDFCVVESYYPPLHPISAPPTAASSSRKSPKKSQGHVRARAKAKVASSRQGLPRPPRSLTPLIVRHRDRRTSSLRRILSAESVRPPRRLRRRRSKRSNKKLDAGLALAEGEDGEGGDGDGEWVAQLVEKFKMRSESNSKKKKCKGSGDAKKVRKSKKTRTRRQHKDCSSGEQSSKTKSHKAKSRGKNKAKKLKAATLETTLPPCQSGGSIPVTDSAGAAGEVEHESDKTSLRSA